MSSKVLRKDSLADISPYCWNAAGESKRVGRDEAGLETLLYGQNTRPHETQPRGEHLTLCLEARRDGDPTPEPAVEPDPGPSWEEYRALETRLRQLEREAPAREQAIRLAAQQEAEAAAELRWKQLMERAARTVVELAALRPKLRKDAEEDVVKLSLAMARRILRRELTLDRGALLGLVKAALERIELREIHQLRLHPDDLPVVKSYFDQIGSPYRIEVLADRSLERGAVLFETQRGLLDASVETQLEEIERGFADLLGKRNQA
ncbi:MAG: flagellar assembly protein FliH [Bryobacteraceae bacterium]|nr:flagellar assembly protein FliH [Bryobacteraceae bacterium]MDW8376755.1 FliH/SctL family protein [Bryobacterales bacterium]